jgi:alkylation response protein AidB-like acyl-CoA dehydrogenase
MKLDILGPPVITADFGFTEEHALARATARKFLGDRCPMSEVRRLHEDARGYDPALWAEVAKLGWVGLVANPDHGGLGLDHLHLALLMDEMGRVLLPSPFFGSLLALRALEAGASPSQQQAFCPPVVAGERVATIALGEPGSGWAAGDVATQAEAVATGFKLTGCKTHVLFGQSADLIIVPAREADGGVALYVVEPPLAGVTLDAEIAIDSTRRLARLTLEGAVVPASSRLEGDGLAALEQVHCLGWVALAAEMAGGIEATLELTRRYAVERVQFGKPIGAFQAVKHPIVDVMIGCEWVRSMVLGAAAALDQDPEHADRFGRMAKALAGDTYALAAQKGVQLHGGFGFTWDCDVHFHLKRSLYSGSTLGDAAHHRQRLGRALVG